MDKLTKVLLATALVLVCVYVNSAFAMRCGTDVITEGDSVLALRGCTNLIAHSNDAWGDKETYVYEMDGMTYTVKVLNNVIQSIDADRG